jgi:hypothetical protein
MRQGSVISAKPANIKKIMLVFVFLGTLANPLILNQFSANGRVLTHYVYAHNHSNFFAYQKMMVPSLLQRTFMSRSSIDSKYNNNNNNRRNKKPEDYYHDTVKEVKKIPLLHRTFRIPEDIIEALEREARSRDVPVSNLLNKILKNYLQADIHSEKSGYILTSKDFYRRMFSTVDEKSVEEYGRQLGFAIADEYTYLYFPQIDSYTIILFLESWFKRFQSYQHAGKASLFQPIGYWLSPAT